MKCPVCHTGTANHSPYGIIPCKECRDRAARTRVNERPVDMVPDRIKEERKKYAKDILQPFRDGQLSKEYIEAHGTDRIDVSESDIKKAKNVWSGDITYYKQ